MPLKQSGSTFCAPQQLNIKYRRDTGGRPQSKHSEDATQTAAFEVRTGALLQSGALRSVHIRVDQHDKARHGTTRQNILS
jgi:hypothetical protein